MPEGIKDLAALLDRELAFSVVLTEKEISIETLLQYTVGSVIMLPDAGTDRLRLDVAGTEIGRGTSVSVGEGLGLRLDDIRSPRDYLPRIV